MTGIENEIASYLNGTMDIPSRGVFESRLASDGFLAAAVEGFRADPEALQDLPALKPGIRFELPVAAGLSLCAGVLLLTMAVGAQLTKRHNPSFKKSYIASDISPAVSNSAEDPGIFPTNTAPIRDTEIHRNKNETALKAAAAEYANERSNADKLKGITAGWISFKRRPSLKTNDEIVYLLDLKTVKYAPENPFPETLSPPAAEGHTPASFENHTAWMQAGNGRKTLSPREVCPATQTEKLEAALLLYQTGKYEAAIRSFHKISDENPNDPNAGFYAGLSYYAIGQYAPALDCFKGVEVSPNQEFRPEAEWYRALCLIKLNRRPEAEALLKVIVQNEGFYADRARTTLMRNFQNRDLTGIK